VIKFPAFSIRNFFFGAVFIYFVAASSVCEFHY